MRKEKRQVSVNGVIIGGNNPVTIQSMTTTPTTDVNATVNQINELEKAGCEIVRIAVPDMTAAECVRDIKRRTNIPVVADIHFDWRIALECVKNGIDKIRINPGNIGGEERVKAVVDACKGANIPIRIGVNSGSVEPEILSKYGVCAKGIVESALRHVKMLERYDFYDTVISLKASSVPMMIEAYRMMHELTDYPLHLGVTEAGTKDGGTVKSCIGIGTLLSEGIGDTIRVSLTADPVEEVKTAIKILKALELRKTGVNIVSCPTCARCRINLIPIAGEVEKRLASCNKNIKVAIMGCAVNGPGEARDADIGIAGGKGEALMFKKGEIFKKVPQESIVDELMAEIEKM